MPYYKKKLALDLYVTVAVEAENEAETKDLIEDVDLVGRNIRLKTEDIVELYTYDAEPPAEITEEQYKKIQIKAKKKR